MRKGVGLGILLLTLISMAVVGMSSSASALSGFSLAVDAEDRPLSQNDQLRITINITNNLGSTDTFRLAVPDVIWDVQSDPLTDYFSGVSIKDGETESVVLLIKTEANLPRGPYQIQYTVTAEDEGIKKEDYFFINVKGNEALLRDYLAAVPHLVSVPESIQAGKETPIIFQLENKGIEELELDIRIQSKLCEQN